MTHPPDAYLPSLRMFNDPILSQVCREITNDVAAIAIARQLEQCVKRYNGLGLAAPQIGLAVQAIIVKPKRDQRGLVMINPKIVGYAGTEIGAQEGCLSYPRVFTRIKRMSKITVEFKAIVWNAHTVKPSASPLVIRTQTFTGLDARIVQHEMDHLIGVCKVGDAWRAAGGAGAVSGVDRQGGAS